MYIDSYKQLFRYSKKSIQLEYRKHPCVANFIDATGKHTNANTLYEEVRMEIYEIVQNKLTRM